MTSWISKEPQRIGLPKCGECGLSTECYSPRMEPSGDGTKNILFVTEAPGENEDRQGIQLIGDAGQFLRECLDDIGEDLDDATKTNCVICRPPGNKITDTHVDCCRPNLLKTIEKLKPNVIILLGGKAVESLLPTEWKKDKKFSITRWRGWTIPSALHKAWICPTYHPSYILRMKKDPVLVSWFKRDLKAAYELEKETVLYTELEKLKSSIELIRKPREVRLFLRDLSKRKGILAFDYETTGLKPEREKQKIVSCSFCLDEEETQAMMIDDSTHKSLSKVLLNPKLKKVASNLKFEDRWSRVKLGHPVAGWFWDTMMAAHILDNRRGITSVKFQSYIYFGVGDYDSHIHPYLEAKFANGLNHIHEIDEEELLIYNGLDSLLEFMVMDHQKVLMGF